MERDREQSGQDGPGSERAARSSRSAPRADEWIFLIVGAVPLGGEPPIGELW